MQWIIRKGAKLISIFCIKIFFFYIYTYRRRYVKFESTLHFTTRGKVPRLFGSRFRFPHGDRDGWRNPATDAAVSRADGVPGVRRIGNSHDSGHDSLARSYPPQRRYRHCFLPLPSPSQVLRVTSLSLYPLYLSLWIYIYLYACVFVGTYWHV